MIGTATPGNTAVLSFSSPSSAASSSSPLPNRGDRVNPIRGANPPTPKRSLGFAIRQGAVALSSSNTNTGVAGAGVGGSGGAPLSTPTPITTESTTAETVGAPATATSLGTANDDDSVATFTLLVLDAATTELSEPSEVSTFTLLVSDAWMVVVTLSDDVDTPLPLTSLVKDVDDEGAVDSEYDSRRANTAAALTGMGVSAADMTNSDGDCAMRFGSVAGDAARLRSECFLSECGVSLRFLSDFPFDLGDLLPLLVPLPARRGRLSTEPAAFLLGVGCARRDR